MLVPAPANRASRSRHSLSFRERVPRTIAVLLEKKDFVNEIPPSYRSRQEWLWRALTVKDGFTVVGYTRSSHENW
ncbi:MAG TPA: hypothetical protein VGP68_23915, partial [Gemmataceae bacterium]|nr:hypothetical protein [Gemmataceae bacterium]